VTVVPASLEHVRHLPGGAAWLDDLPGLVEAAVHRWDLRLGAPYDDVYESMTFPADLPDGTAAVLKVRYPNRESEHEADALRAWNGNGAARLIDEDPDLHALLLERCVPGTPLSEAGQDAALRAFVDLLPRLWIPAADPFSTLSEESSVLARDLVSEWQRTGRIFERRLVDVALDAFASLPVDQGPPVLLHQDLHADNVLAGHGGTWLAIDPKPLAGEREFGIAPIVRSAELGTRREDVVRRFDRLTADLALDRRRARLWTVAHAVAWSFETDGVLAMHVNTARWLLEAQ
jgi:streptomycin 6-kinase